MCLLGYVKMVSQLPSMSLVISLGYLDSTMSQWLRSEGSGTSDFESTYCLDYLLLPTWGGGGESTWDMHLTLSTSKGKNGKWEMSSELS